jgi:hypothetical protein
VASKKLFTITLTVDPEQCSEDALEWGMEGFFNLLDNIVRDGIEHAEPRVVIRDLRVSMETINEDEQKADIQSVINLLKGE